MEEDRRACHVHESRSPLDLSTRRESIVFVCATTDFLYVNSRPASRVKVNDDNYRFLFAYVTGGGN